ncbi:MAG: antibiotic biosynthesis monooxygenase [Salinivirgaceae bacterium]
MIAQTPETPYYAVIFTSVRTDGDNGYAAVANKMLELAKKQKGFLGVESAREELGITVSYWTDLESIRNWKIHSEHTEARNLGREIWYKSFRVRIAKIESAYGFDKF